jgi:hydrogenase nickel incorporation protein HypB
VLAVCDGAVPHSPLLAAEHVRAHGHTHGEEPHEHSGQESHAHDHGAVGTRSTV